MGLIRRNIRVLLHPRRYRAELARAGKMLRSLTEAKGDVPDRIRELLGSDAWEVRNCAVKIIVRTHCEELYPVLVEKLTEAGESGIVKRNCAELLPFTGQNGAGVVEALRRALRDRYWEARAEAARALAVLAGDSAELELELLGLLEGERNMEARAGLVQALGALGMGRSAFDRLAELAGESSWLVRHQAAVALAELGARHPEFAADASEVIGRLDLLAEGAATQSVFRQRILELARLTGDGRPFPTADALRKRYFHLKWGWLRPID